jgi:hypothetical protein
VTLFASAMPLQNRVGPRGEIFRTTARGTMLGNRGGAIHNDNREIVRQFRSRQWICCVLEFKGRRRTVMSPKRYTELFFLDEAVALAAGHRPCAECRRERFNAFRQAWEPQRRVPAPEIDVDLHRARIDKRGQKVTYAAPLDTLPDGAFALIEDASCLVWQEALLLWSPEGYIGKRARPSGLTVEVLTPGPIVECIRRGYQPAIHDSAVTLLSRPAIGFR